MNKTIKNKNIMFRIVTIFLILVATILSVPRLTGFTIYNIETTSMEPNYPPGTLIYVKKTDFNQIKNGDIITYVNERGSTVTHRVVSVNQSEKSVKTKGDANQFEDVIPVYEENIVGKVCYKIPYLGYVSDAITKIFKN